MEVTLRRATAIRAWRPLVHMPGHGERDVLTMRQRSLFSHPRVTRQSLQGGRRWAALAGRIAGRYAAGSLVWRGLQMLLLSAHPASLGMTKRPLLSQQVLQHSAWWSLNLPLRLTTPAIHLAIHQRLLFSEPGSSARTDVAYRTQASIVQQPGIFADERSKTALSARVRQQEKYTTWYEAEFIDRILARYQRQKDDVLQGTPRMEAVPPVPKIFIQPLAASAVASNEAKTLNQPALPALQYWDGTAHVPDPALVNIERLTDQVMQAIDQRMVAARERLGKR